MTLIKSLPVRLSAFLSIYAAMAVVSPGSAYAQQAAGTAGDPVTNALLWMQSILLGPIATTLAVMAIAGIGFMMLTGRMNWRYGATVIIGVFIIFGAPRLVATISAV